MLSGIEMTLERNLILGEQKMDNFVLAVCASWDEFRCGFTNEAGVVQLMCDSGNRKECTK